MSQWRIKCAKLTSQIRGKSARLFDMTTHLGLHADDLHDTGLRYTENEARERHNKLAALNDQYDQAIVIVNRLVRVTRGRSNASTN